MLSFKVLKKSSRSSARLGILSTPHGDIETPAFVPVATRASVRTLPSHEVVASGAQLLIANTFHLHITPGEKIVKDAGGIHTFMHWNKPLMTDSGGFQVFSMGFGTDHGMGKILDEKPDESIAPGIQPKKIQITEDGVFFRSPKDGSKLFIGPKESIRIQEQLGADIMYAFDECPSPLANAEYMHASLEKTHRWAQVCLNTRTGSQALYGIVQGGSFKDLRAKSAQVIGAMGFDGFGIGGEFGYNKENLRDVVAHTNAHLPEDKPRHLLGVGHPEDFPFIVESGADTFDCIAPTHYARHGTLFTSVGRLNMTNAQHIESHTVIDPTCLCPVCTSYSRAYLSHLFRSHEVSALTLATIHNLHYLNALAKQMREKIARDEI